MTYAQPALALLDAPARPTWKAVVDQIAASGLKLERQPQPGPGAMESHRAEWWAAATLSNGDYVWVRVLNYRGTLRWAWQMYGYRHRNGVQDHRVMLHDPTPREAMAALTVLGLDGGESHG